MRTNAEGRYEEFCFLLKLQDRIVIKMIIVIMGNKHKVDGREIVNGVRVGHGIILASEILHRRRVGTEYRIDQDRLTIHINKIR